MNLRRFSILTICLAVAYSALVAVQQHPKMWDWLNTLVATGISFFLALVAGLYLFNQQTSTMKQSEHADLLVLLVAELSDLVRILSDSSKMAINFQGGEQAEVLITFVQPLVVEKAALSGRFNTMESENLLHAARKIRMFNVKCDYLLGLLQGRPERDMLMHAIRNLEETRIAIIDVIRHVAGQLKLQLTEKYPD